MESRLERTKKCKACGQPFTPVKFAQVTCHTVACAQAYGQQKAAKLRAAKAREEAKELRERKKNAKTRGQWLREAQSAFNKWIRLRDADLPCISSGRHHHGQYHAGHYRTTAAAPQLRFNPDNVHKQSSYDNNFKSGNIVEFRINLIKKIGVDRVEALENDNTSHYWTIDELKEIKEKYTALARELEQKQ